MRGAPSLLAANGRRAAGNGGANGFTETQRLLALVRPGADHLVGRNTDEGNAKSRGQVGAGSPRVGTRLQDQLAQFG